MKISLALLTCLALAGCATSPQRVVSQRVAVVPAAVTPIPQQVRGASQRSTENAMLQPGASYIASFPEADRRAACDRLNYRRGTSDYSECLIGNFPENPYFSAAVD